MESTEAVSGPLSGITVIDLSIWAVGSLAGLSLAELGADVIKVEAPHGDPGRGLQWYHAISCELSGGRNAHWEAFNRGKKSIVLDLKTRGGKQVLYDLAATADVFLHNFRPGVAERLGFGYEDLRPINPQLVYGASSAYGPYGPDTPRPGLDYVAQARSGFMASMKNERDEPTFHLGAIADATGGIMLAQGILAGLVSRSLSGEGCQVDTSQLGAMMWLQFNNVGLTLLAGGTSLPRSDRTKAPNPVWNHYRCADGRWIVLGLLQADRHWPAFCRAIGREDLLANERYATGDLRRDNNEELIQLLDAVMAEKRSSEWAEILSRDGDLVFEIVTETMDLLADPQVRANDYLVDLAYEGLDSRPVLRVPFHFNGTAVRSTAPGPGLGEHTWEVLLERLGYSSEQLEQLAIEGAIG